jgi:3-oxoacyl-[acyl-carrier-protein] synthase-3
MLPPIGIASIGASVPETVLTNADLERMVDTSDEWIVSRTGIRERRVLGREGRLRPYVANSGREALSRAGLAPADLDFIISSAMIPDRFCPAQSIEVARDLEADRAFCFDVNASCSGFVYGLAVAESFLKSRDVRRGLVTAADQLTTVTDYADRNSCILFGDGAAAAVVTSVDPAHRILYSELGSTASMCEDVVVGGIKDALGDRRSDLWFRQDGRKVYKFALDKMKELFESVPRRAGIPPSAVRYVIPHQANGRIIDAGATAVGGKAEFISVIDRYGNTSSSSIGLALHDAWERFRPGDIVMLLGFGGGMTWGAVLIEW